MVGQQELSKYAEVNADIEALTQEKETLRKRLLTAYRNGEEIEEGRLILKATINDEAERTAWKPVVETIKKYHPELRGGIEQIVIANTVVQPYEQLRVVPRA